MLVIWPDVLVDVACVCLARVITHVLRARLVVYLHVLLGSLTENPKLPHFHCT